MLISTRVLPVFISFLVSNYIVLYLSNIREAQNFVLKSINTPFTKFYLLFIFINSISGVFNGISVNWMLWKNFEMLTGVLWFVSFHSLYFYVKFDDIVEKIGFILLLFFISICTYEVYFLLKTYSYTELLFVVRPEIELPKINPIKLSIFAAYIAIYSSLKCKRKNFIWLFLSFFGLLLILMAKSRTGFIVVVLFFLYEQFISNNKIVFRVLLCSSIFMVSSFIFSQYLIDFATIMRINDFDVLLNGGGRLKSMDSGGTSSWGESLKLISNHITMGIGNINTKRFLDTKIYSVDNFILQNLIAGGLVGGGLLSFWAFFVFPLGFWRYFKKHKEKYKKNKIRLANMILIIFFVKSFSTNGASFFGIEFLFLGISYAIFNKVKIQ